MAEYARQQLLELQVRIGDQIVTLVSEKFPTLSYDQNKCRRDVCMIIDAITLDVLEDTNNHSTYVGMSYLYNYRGVVFRNQKSPTLYAIKELRNICLASISNRRIKKKINARFDLLLDIIGDSTIKQVKTWDLAAKLLPLVALCIISVTYFFDYPDLRELSIITTIVVFFTIGVTWWWWAIYKIAHLAINMKQNRQQFKEIVDQIDQVREDIRDL